MKTILASLTMAAVIGVGSASAQVYLDIGVGGNFLGDYDVKTTQPLSGGAIPTGTAGTFKINPGFAVNFEVGAKVAERVSVGILSGFSQSSVDDVIVGGVSASSQGADIDGTVTVIPILAVTDYHIPLSDKLTLKLGVGLGCAFINAEPKADLATVFTEGDTTVFQYQLRSSLNYNASENTSVGLTYRFSGLHEPSFDAIDGDTIYGHFIGAAVNIRF